MADLSSLLGAAGIGGAIGQAIVRLELDTSKYLGEMKAAEGQTVASTNAMGTSTAKFGQFAQTALLGAGVAVVAFAASSVKAAIEANDAHLKLQNTFANNASLADSSVEAFEHQADALRDLTGVDDEAIISAQALLGQFKLTGGQVQQLIPLIVDLSEKMDIDLQAAAKAVGKATQGNAGILSRYGIVLDETALKTDAFGTTLKGLGVVQGFAAESAKIEPWRVLGAQFEELQETVGQVLIPILQSLVPVIQDVVTILQFAAGATEGFDKAVQGATRSLAEHEIHLAAWLEEHTQSIPIIGGVVDVYDKFKAVLDSNDEALVTQRGVIGDISDFYRGKYAGAVAAAGKATSHFAHMTNDELKEWSTKTKESFQSYVINLDKVNEATDFTRKDLRDSFRAMLEHARDLNQAMRTLSKEHWINDDFVKFLAEQPDKLILFAESNETQQRRMQHQWEVSGQILDTKINQRLDVMTGVLDHLDKGETKHTVIIQYRYEGFDPSKPGMSGSAQQR